MPVIQVTIEELGDIVDALSWSGSKNGWLARRTRNNPVAAASHSARSERAYRTCRYLNDILREAVQRRISKLEQEPNCLSQESFKATL